MASAQTTLKRVTSVLPVPPTSTTSIPDRAPFVSLRTAVAENVRRRRAPLLGNVIPEDASGAITSIAAPPGGTVVVADAPELVLDVSVERDFEVEETSSAVVTLVLVLLVVSCTARVEEVDSEVEVLRVVVEVSLAVEVSFNVDVVDFVSVLFSLVVVSVFVFSLVVLVDCASVLLLVDLVDVDLV